MRINREKIQRMIDAQGGSSGGGGMSSAAFESMLAMYATRQWVGENFLNVKEGGTVEAPVTFEDTVAIDGAVTMGSTLDVTGNITMGTKLVATQEWTNLNYVSIAFFSRLFQAYNGNTAVNPNDTTTAIDNIKAMFGFWTNFYISALGTGGASTLGLRLSQLDDVNVAGVTNGQVLTWNTSTGKWIASTPSSGVDMATVWAAMAAVDTSKKIDNSHLKLDTFFTDFSNAANNNTSITIGGVTKSIVIGYATNAGDAATLGGTAKSGLLTDFSNITTGGEAGKTQITVGGTTLKLQIAYADYAAVAGRLSGNSSYTIWGQTYWSSGTPNSVSGDLYLNGSNLRLLDYGGSADCYICAYGTTSRKIGVSVEGSSLFEFNDEEFYSVHGIYAGTYVTALSDIRFKEVVNRFQLDVETIAKASLIQYRWKDKRDDVLHVGGIAQEWQKILPETVHEDKEGRLSMDYGVIAFTSAVSLARRIQDQQKEIGDLREKNAQLERRLQRLESMFAVDVD